MYLIKYKSTDIYCTGYIKTGYRKGYFHWEEDIEEALTYEDENDMVELKNMILQCNKKTSDDKLMILYIDSKKIITIEKQIR
jgi:hypothetical protein